MKKVLYLSAGLFVITSLFWAVMILSSVYTSRSVQAQANEENRAAPRRWEYCSVVPVNGFSEEMGKYRGTAMIYYTRDGEARPEKVEATISDRVKLSDSVMAKAVTKLGSEGWEMVGEGTFLNYASNDGKVLYFKRPAR